ncbi:zinc-dependent alcohol dehydrogenase family protein [Craterilacuibacter sp.]|uniref:zinc-dependent alcohol dehydrogenase family protein n=1 Tax=Craterilacuibacter sp. TaxID=2870909 RepID=UPI003F3AD980
MKAMIIRQTGTPDVFELAELPVPEPRAGQVRIRVMASAVNPIDCKIRSGAVPLVPAYPAVLQGDMAGVVDALGPGVTDFAVGDAVFGFIGGLKSHQGALAEYALADVRLLALKPGALDFAAAAALPVVGMTAWEGLIERACIEPGQTVLVQGGAGGVGHVAVQLAHAAGCRVVATVSGKDKGKLARQLGADEIVYYRDETVADYVARLTGGRGFDVVFDSVGGASLDASLQAAAVGGKVVAIAARSTHDLSPMHGKGLDLAVVFSLSPFVHGSGFERIGQRLRKLASLVEAGKLRVVLDPHVFTLQAVGAAHALIESGGAHGKVVVRVAG